jgi:hypothetical protein
MRERLAAVNHLRSTLPLVRRKAKMLQRRPQALLSGPSKVLELGAGYEIDDERPGIAQLVGADRPNNGGAK